MKTAATSALFDVLGLACKERKLFRIMCGGKTRRRGGAPGRPLQFRPRDDIDWRQFDIPESKMGKPHGRGSRVKRKERQM